MKSPAGHPGLDDEPNDTRDAASRGAVTALLILATGCLTVAGLGHCGAEAAPLPAIVEASQTSVPAARPAAVPAAPTAADPRAAMLLPSNASAELRRLARNAIAGQANAQNDLGTFFALGIEVPRNLDQAAYWYRRAADQGVSSAAYNLGVLLERGLGVPRDPDAAVARFREAAEAGHAGALNALGLAYLSGSGVACDPAEALIWFRRASTGGNPRGAYNAARLYESGQLGVPDPQTAVGWYRVAADAGDDQARIALARLQAIAGAGVSAARIGFVNLVPGASLLVLDQTGMPAAGPDPILDSLAAQMAGSVTPGPVEAANASASAASEPRPAVVREQPFTAAQIREIQQLLARMNLDVGRIDGRMGRRTRAAIAAFQRSQDLPVTRRPSMALLQMLRTTTMVASRD